MDTSNELYPIWQIELTLIKRLLSVCQEHNLRIWAGWGTLLGTIRHHGFIPWDDDADFIMMRDDYERLKQIASSEFSSPFFFQTAYTDKHYYRGHAQLRYDNTAAILPEEIHCTFHQGIFIDIFVMDAIPDDAAVLKSTIRRGEMLRRLLYWGALPLSKEHIARSMVQCLCHAYFVVRDYHKTFARYEHLYATAAGSDSTLVGMPTFSVKTLQKYHLKRCWFDNTIYVPFEDINMPVPANYHDILTELYGDYMTPVKAASYHGTVIFSTTEDYKQIIAKQIIAKHNV